MKSFIGICFGFLFFTLLTASAQIPPTPKQSPAKSKADSFESFKTKISKLTDDNDYFSKTTGGKNDSAGLSSMVAFAELDSFLDASLSWKAQRNNTDVFVTTASPLFNTDHYDGFIITPRQAKILHLDVTGSLFSSNTFSPTYVPFYLQVKAGKTVYCNAG